MKILITGALSGLGFHYAKTLSQRGHIVYIGVKTEVEAISLEQKCWDQKLILFPVVLNLEETSSLQIFDEIEIDVLILQAGSGEGGSLLEISLERLEKNYQVNVFGNLRFIQAFLRVKQKKKQPGKIFLTSSLAAFLPLPYLGSYTSTKMSLYSLAKTLRLELFYQHVPVSISVILPGAYFTGFNEVMINNKDKDQPLLPIKAYRMTKYQKYFFTLMSSSNYESLTKKVVTEVEANAPSFIIAAPWPQVLFVKCYRLVISLLELSILS